MMTHGNLLATVSAVLTIVPELGTKDVYLAYLPLAHVLELAAEVRMSNYFHENRVNYFVTSLLITGIF